MRRSSRLRSALAHGLRRCHSARGPDADTGSMAVELVILVPVMLAFLLLVVAGGRYVSVRGDVEAAARDAARAASLERSSGAAARVAASTANASLSGRLTCSNPSIGGTFTRGGVVTVTLHCRVPYDGLGLLGLPGSLTLTADSSAPLDPYRRTSA